jgi:hypothetical protein
MELHICRDKYCIAKIPSVRQSSVMRFEEGTRTDATDGAGTH